MPSLKEFIQGANPFGAAAAALTPGEKREKEKVAEASVGHEPNEDREEEELTKAVGTLQAYAKRKGIKAGATPAEIRLFHLQSKRAEPAKKKVPSYRLGTKKVPKTGMAKLHKGEAVLNAKQAKKFRKLKGAASLLGAGKAKKAKRG